MHAAISFLIHPSTLQNLGVPTLPQNAEMSFRVSALPWLVAEANAGGAEAASSFRMWMWLWRANWG